MLTIDPGDANYFVVPVTNDWTITDNYWDQQTSLNNVQAKRNATGSTRSSSRRPIPASANWVSTGGLNQGTISIRFQDLPLDPTHLPTVQSQVVPLSQLAQRAARGHDLRHPRGTGRPTRCPQGRLRQPFAPYPQRGRATPIGSWRGRTGAASTWTGSAPSMPT